jgi:hypothetical protein
MHRCREDDDSAQRTLEVVWAGVDQQVAIFPLFRFALRCVALRCVACAQPGRIAYVDDTSKKYRTRQYVAGWILYSTP